MKKAYFNWSSGKDSAFALHQILQQKEYEIQKLITSINSDFNRVSMHGLRAALLDAQTKNLGFPLEKIPFAGNVTMEVYNQTMQKKTNILVNEGFTHAIFGDIFLEDLRAYRDVQLAKVGITGVYPLWKKNTKNLLYEFLDAGFKTITVCTNAKLLGKEFVGRIIDEDFIKDLPDSVDVCGENGEFHTFCFDGPIFKSPVKFTIGEKVLRTYKLHEKDEDNCYSQNKTKRPKNYDNQFWYCDLIPEN